MELRPLGTSVYMYRSYNSLMCWLLRQRYYFDLANYAQPSTRSAVADSTWPASIVPVDLVHGRHMVSVFFQARNMKNPLWGWEDLLTPGQTPRPGVWLFDVRTLEYLYEGCRWQLHELPQGWCLGGTIPCLDTRCCGEAVHE